MFVNVSQNYQFLKVLKDYSIIVILYHYHKKKIYITEEITFVFTYVVILLPIFIMEMSRGQELGL